MSRQSMIFNGKIEIWESDGEFVAEHNQWKRRYCCKAPSVMKAITDLLDEMAKDGLFGSGRRELRKDLYL